MFRKTARSYLSLSVLALSLSVIPVTQAFAKTAATVNGVEIIENQITQFYQDSPAAQRGIPIADVREAILEQLISAHLIDEKIDESAFGEKEEVKERVRAFSSDLIRDLWLQEQIKTRLTSDYLKARYTEIVAELADEYEIKARHILVESKEDALGVIRELDAGADFETLAKERSVGPSNANGGDLGYFTRGAMVPDFSESAFATDVGDYTRTPVQTQFGWHIIKVEDKRELKAPAYEDLEPRIRAEASKEILNQVLAELQQGAKIEIKK